MRRTLLLFTLIATSAFAYERLQGPTEGHFFEVTADGKLAWEYINPVTRDGAVKVLGDVLPMTNSVFRAYRYGLDHPAFKGRDLTPKGTITERAAQGLDPQPRRDGGRGGRGGAISFRGKAR